MISGTVTGDDRVIARVGGLSVALRAILVASLKRQWYRLQAKVVTDKLSGNPLKRPTGVLASSINVRGPETATSFEEGTDEIVGRIGTRVRYGKIHEYGGTVQIPAHTRRKSTIVGRAVAEQTNSEVADKAIDEQTINVRAHTATYPERSFLRSTLSEERSAILAAIRADMARGVSEV